MFSNKWILIIPVCLITVVYGAGQSALNSCYGFDCKEKKMSFSFFVGIPLLGSGKDIADGLIASGLGDIRPAFRDVFGYEKAENYPKRSGLAWNFELRHNLSERSGYQINAGIINQSNVQGYEYARPGNYISINSKVQAVSLNYIWRTGEGMSGFTIGPTLARHVVQAGQSYLIEYKSSDIKAGVNLGYTFAIVESKKWFLAVKTNYTWLPDVEIGPYMAQSDNYVSTFQKTTIRLQSLNLGVSAGWRF